MQTSSSWVAGYSAAARRYTWLRPGSAEYFSLKETGSARERRAQEPGFIGEWAAGYLTSWGAHELAVERYALDFYARLTEKEPSFGYKKNGNLWAATDQSAWDSYIQPLVDSEHPTKRIVLDGRGVADATGIIPADATIGGTCTLRVHRSRHTRLPRPSRGLAGSAE